MKVVVFSTVVELEFWTCAQVGLESV